MAGKTTEAGGKVHDQVAFNQIWKEHCKKERENLTLRETFTLSPKSMIIFPDKPNQPHAVVKQGTASSEVLSELKETIANTKKTPLEKYDAPRTSAQEIGWYNKPLLASRQSHCLSQCDITRYAADFTSALGHSPFVKKRADGQPAA